MHDYLIALILGIIEGITEFLPISSTGHLLIAQHWLGPQSELFNIGIQAGAILAVTLIYWKRIWQLATGLKAKENWDYTIKLSVAFLITAVLGLIAGKMGLSLPDTVQPVAWALIVGALVMFWAEHKTELNAPETNITWTVAIAVGLAQVIAAIFPGTSRSAATIFAAMLFGTKNRGAATEFSFLVGIPTMYAASAYALFKELDTGADENWSAFAIGFVASTITAFIAVKWLLKYIQTHRFTGFAWYRIVLGGALLLLLPSP
ncbi:MAG TPA: undecaprenyl-diphosphate phosphatase [Arenimonas sp.]|nr:undecaprenyl-diphosphate phosphatase [Arenimonas sp.]